jgi:glutamate mutase epsilon subunit
MNERTNRALVTGQKLLRNVSLKNGDLSNDIKKQIGDLDTKDRKIELTETDIKLNQNIIEILYTILIGVAISIVIMIVSYFMKWDNGISQSSVTSSTSNSDSLLDKVGSLFKFNSNGNNYKGNLLSTDSGISGSLFKIGGNKK